jgi:hypothetical protein
MPPNEPLQINRKLRLAARRFRSGGIRYALCLEIPDAGQRGRANSMAPCIIRVRRQDTTSLSDLAGQRTELSVDSQH